MRQIDFDVFALISPLKSPVEITPDAPPDRSIRRPPRSYALILANSIRANKFFLPQVELLGKQMTQGPSPVRVLRFGRYEVPDYALRKVINELEKDDQRAIHAYLWSNGEVAYDAVHRKYVEVAPPFPRDTERAFKRVFKILEQLGVLKRCLPQERGEDDGGNGVP